MKQPKINWEEEHTPKKKTPKPKATSTSVATDKTGFVGGYFMPLGWDSEEKLLNYYYYVNSSKSIVRLAASKMSKQNLLMLAPLEFWIERFPNSQSFDALVAADFLITVATDRGFFSLDKIRGRGAWMDNNRVVFHAGTHLIIDGERLQLGATKTECIYEMRSQINIPIENPMPVEESHRLTKMLQLLGWATMADARLLSGWIAIAPVCGVLNWRPHLWITGTKASGKSWLMDDIINKMIAGVSVVFQGNTSEMGLMQKLNNDAFAVSFDEAEGNDEKAAQRMQNLMSAARSASTRDGAAQVKGGKDGRARDYVVKSCFLFSSINPQIVLDSDKRRFCVLEITKLKDNDAFRKIESTRAEMLTADYARRFQARMITILPQMLKTIEVFVSAITVLSGNKSTGDQIGTLLGGWWHTWNDEIVTEQQATDEARAILEAIGTSGSKGDSTDEQRCLQAILGTERRIESDTFFGTRTIGELVEIASDRPTGGDGIKQDEANRHLSRLGMLVVKMEGIEYLAILNTSVHIEGILRKVSPQWAVSFKTVLCRIQGAIKPEKGRHFSPGLNGRYFCVPITEIFK